MSGVPTDELSEVQVSASQRLQMLRMSDEMRRLSWLVEHGYRTFDACAELARIDMGSGRATVPFLACQIPIGLDTTPGQSQIPSGTYAGSGSPQSITGVGFKPKAVFIRPGGKKPMTYVFRTDRYGKLEWQIQKVRGTLTILRWWVAAPSFEDLLYLEEHGNYFWSESYEEGCRRMLRILHGRTFENIEPDPPATPVSLKETPVVEKKVTRDRILMMYKDVNESMDRRRR